MEGTLRRVRSPPAALWTETLDNLWRINWLLRSFSLWARHPAETSAELNVRLGAAEFFPGASRQVRRVRKRRRGGNARAAQGTASGRESYTIQTCDPSVSRTAVRWGPQFSSSAPPRSPAPSFDHFPFGPRPWSFSFRPIMRFLVIVILYVTASAFKGLHRIFFEIQQPTVRCDKCKYLVASYLW